MRAFRSFRIRRAVGTVGLLFSFGCADLQPIAVGECGNGVIDSGEDCDTFGRLAMTCRPPGTTGACHFDCTDENECTEGYACGSDEICRAPSAAFEHRLTLADPANVIALDDFDGNGAVDVLAADWSGVVLSYQNSDFEELDTVDLTLISGGIPLVGAQLTEDEIADVAYLDTDSAGLGVARGTEQRTLAGTVYPTVAMPSNDGVIFALEGVNEEPGDEAVALVELPGVGTVVTSQVRDSPTTVSNVLISDAGVLPSLRENPGTTVRVGNLDPDKPCDQYVLAFPDAVFVGTPCQNDGQWNASPVDTARSELAPTPIPLAEIDLAQCDGEISRAFVIDVNDDANLDVVLVPTAPQDEFDPNGDAEQSPAAEACLLLGPLTLSEGPSVDLVAEPYPLFSLASNSYEEVLALAHLNGDTVPDLVTSHGIFTSEPEKCLGGQSFQRMTPGSGVFCTTLASDSEDYYYGPLYVSAAVGDINGDDTPDVALASLDLDGVEVHIGRGDGVFGVYNVEAEGAPNHLLLADFDADGVDDLMFADQACTQPGDCSQTSDQDDILTVAFGRTSGGPEEPASLGRLPRIQALQTGRFVSVSGSELDAAVDVGVLARDPVDDSLGFAVLFGNTRRELRASFYFPSVTPEDQATFWVPISFVAGRFAPEEQSATQQDLAVATMRYEIDPAMGISPDPELRLWLADVTGDAKLSASGVWPSAQPLGGWDQFNPYGGAMAAGDLNGDDLDEVVYASGKGLAIARVSPSEAGEHPGFSLSSLPLDLAVGLSTLVTLEDSFEGTLGTTSSALQLGDVDGDGQQDIVVIGGTEEIEVELLVLWNDDGQFDLANSARVRVPVEASAYLLVNLDDDAELEILLAVGETFAAYEARDHDLRDFPTPPALVSEGGVVSVMQSADFDEDGVPDLVLGHPDAMTFYRGVPAGQLTSGAQ